MKRMSPSSFVKSAPSIETSVSTPSVSTMLKWIPFICAGAAAGVSLIALSEIKNVRKELSVLKQVQPGDQLTKQLNKRMESMEHQLKLLSDFVQNKQKIVKESDVIRNVMKQSESPEIHIINGEEYEEVEVTDDEADEVNEVNEVNEVEDVEEI